MEDTDHFSNTRDTKPDGTKNNDTIQKNVKQSISKLCKTTHQQQRPLSQVLVGAEAREARQQRPLPGDQGSAAPVRGRPAAGRRPHGFQEGARDRVAEHAREKAVDGLVESG